jgi:hypothetical protein
MPSLAQIEKLARKTFELPTARAAKEGAHVGVWAQPKGYSEVFLEYRDGSWYVLHGDQLHDCGNPPVRDLQQLKDHIVDGNAD